MSKLAARRLRALGVSAATMPQYRLNATKLTKAIDAALTDPTFATNARALAPRLAAEDGATAGLTIIESYWPTPEPLHRAKRDRVR